MMVPMSQAQKDNAFSRMLANTPSAPPVAPGYQKNALNKGLAGFGGLAKGGSIKKYARGGGIESKGKTRGKFI
jgi:hypothetical protein